MPRLIRRQLDNGLRYILEPDPASQAVAVSIWLTRGSRDEGGAENGLTHFAEHMLFKGTHRRDWHELARLGNRLGGLNNAMTSVDWMKIYGRVIRDDLEAFFGLLAEMILESSFPEKEFDREKGVILEEIAQYEDSPEDLCYDEFSKALLLPDPTGRPIIGTHELISGYRREDLTRFWHDCLKPENLMVSIAGGIDPDATERLIRKTFEELEPGSGLWRESTPATGHSRRVLLERDLEQIQFCLGVTGPSRNGPDRLAWSVYDSILGGGMGSRLFDEIRERRGLAYSIGSSLTLFRDAGYLVISGSTNAETAATAIQICREQLELLAAEEPTAEELDTARRQLMRSHLLALESMSYRATINAEREIYGLEHLETRQLLDRLEAISVGDIREIARQVTGAGAPAICLVGPIEEIPGLDNALPDMAESA